MLNGIAMSAGSCPSSVHTPSYRLPTLASASERNSHPPIVRHRARQRGRPSTAPQGRWNRRRVVRCVCRQPASGWQALCRSRRGLLGNCRIGSSRPAAEVTPGDIVPHLSAIHDRGAKVHAAKVRAYLSAAFAYGLKAEHDYTRKDAGARWGIASNPISAIPVADGISNPRNRFLTPAEVRTLWTWLEGYDVDSRLAPALRLMLATGQRSEEILRITASTYESSRALIFWERTKNGLPHSIPLPHQATKIIDGLHYNAHGLFFACATDPTRPAQYNGLRCVLSRFLKAHPEIPHFVPRDARRTFKTLAGDAGLSKEMRDLLQNHTTKSDVSSRHYDRYSYLPERRAAVATISTGCSSGRSWRSDNANQTWWRSTARRCSRP